MVIFFFRNIYLWLSKRLPSGSVFFLHTFRIFLCRLCLDHIILVSSFAIEKKIIGVIKLVGYYLQVFSQRKENNSPPTSWYSILVVLCLYLRLSVKLDGSSILLPTWSALVSPLSVASCKPAYNVITVFVQ